MAVSDDYGNLGQRGMMKGSLYTKILLPLVLCDFPHEASNISAGDSFRLGLRGMMALSRSHLASEMHYTHRRVPHLTVCVWQVMKSLVQEAD